MLDSGQRERNYLHQRCCEPTGGHCREDLTSAQTRRIRKKKNKAKGDAPRSRKQRWLTNLQAAIEEKRKSLTDDYKSRLKHETNLIEDKGLADYEVMAETIGERRANRDPQSDTAQEIERRRDLRERVEGRETSLTEARVDELEEAIEEAPEGKPLCPTCEPVAPDWACRTKSGKKTRDHAGRMR